MAGHLYSRGVVFCSALSETIGIIQLSSCASITLYIYDRSFLGERKKIIFEKDGQNYYSSAEVCGRHPSQRHKLMQRSKLLHPRLRKNCSPGWEEDPAKQRLDRALTSSSAKRSKVANVSKRPPPSLFCQSRGWPLGSLEPDAFVN